MKYFWGILVGFLVLGGAYLGFQDNFIPGSTSSSVTDSSTSGYERTDDFTTERSYETTGDMDCSDFSSQEEAQEFFEAEGGPDEDYHNLDRDGDGYVCETL